MLDSDKPTDLDTKSPNNAKQSKTYFTELERITGHKKIKEQLKADVYFAHPYHSWERSLNENTNGLLKQYFTKGSRFENITDKKVEAVMHKLNHRPRKILNYKIPHAVFLADPEQEAA